MRVRLAVDAHRGEQDYYYSREVNKHMCVFVCVCTRAFQYVRCQWHIRNSGPDNMRLNRGGTGAYVCARELCVSEYNNICQLSYTCAEYNATAPVVKWIVCWRPEQHVSGKTAYWCGARIICTTIHLEYSKLFSVELDSRGWNAGTCIGLHIGSSELVNDERMLSRVWNAGTLALIPLAVGCVVNRRKIVSLSTVWWRVRMHDYR